MLWAIELELTAWIPSPFLHGDAAGAGMPTNSAPGLQARFQLLGRGGQVAVAAEQAVEVVAHHCALLATVLEQEPGQGRLHQSVLIPLRMFRNEARHGLVEILGELVHDAHKGRRMVGHLAHTALAKTQPSGHGEAIGVKTANRL